FCLLLCSTCAPSFFFFHSMSISAIYTLSLHDALPISDENYSLSPLSRGEIWAASYSGIPSHCTWLVSVRRRRYGSRRYRHTGADVGYTGAVARLGCSEPRERVAGTAVRRT